MTHNKARQGHCIIFFAIILCDAAARSTAQGATAAQLEMLTSEDSTAGALRVLCCERTKHGLVCRWVDLEGRAGGCKRIHASQRWVDTDTHHNHIHRWYEREMSARRGALKSPKILQHRAYNGWVGGWVDRCVRGGGLLGFGIPHAEAHKLSA